MTDAATTTRRVPTYCYQCVAGPDLLTVKVRNGVATEVEPNFCAEKIHPGGGKVCVKAFGLVQKTYNPNRVLAPMKRSNPRKGKGEDPQFVEISWDEAFGLIADKLGSLLSDYMVTESGFASDIGFEKFWNIKCRCSGLKPDAVVIVATVRALKLHGGGPAVQAGRPLDPVYTGENLELLEKGCDNLLAHIGIVKRSGIRPVVCLNSFHTDTPAEHALVRRVSEAAGARFAVSDHWLRGGEGALELAEAVVEACEDSNHFDFLSDLDEPLSDRIAAITEEVYGGDGVSYSDEAKAKLAAFEADPAIARLPVCMAKTQYSLSHDSTLTGRPRGWTLPVRDLLIYQGAGLVVPVTGDIKLMPGTASNAAFRRIDIDTATGKVKGLF